MWNEAKLCMSTFLHQALVFHTVASHPSRLTASQNIPDTWHSQSVQLSFPGTTRNHKQYVHTISTRCRKQFKTAMSFTTSTPLPAVTLAFPFVLSAVFCTTWRTCHIIITSSSKCLFLMCLYIFRSAVGEKVAIIWHSPLRRRAGSIFFFHSTPSTSCRHSGSKQPVGVIWGCE